jgi:hypothetical protein
VVKVPTPAQTGRLRCLYFLSPQGQADADGSGGGGGFQNGSFAPKIPLQRQTRIEFSSLAECYPCETAGSTLRNVRFEGPGRDHEER